MYLQNCKLTKYKIQAGEKILEDEINSELKKHGEMLVKGGFAHLISDHWDGPRRRRYSSTMLCLRNPFDSKISPICIQFDTTCSKSQAQFQIELKSALEVNQNI